MSRADKNARVEAALGSAIRGPQWWRIECPFCLDDGHRDRKKSLGVSASTGFYECFRCGARGRLEGPPDPSAVREASAQTIEELRAMEPPPEYIPLWRGSGLRAASLEPARDYLRGRGLDLPLWRDFQLGAAIDGYWAGRVIIPALSPDEDDPVWLGWIARLWCNPSRRAEGPASMKYLYPKGMQRGVTFWNHRALFADTDEPVMVMEGALDAIGYGQDAVACLGKLSHLQTDALLACKRPISIVLDGDAWQESWAIAMRLRFEGQRAGYVRLPPRVDPDEVDKDWLRAEARKSLEVVL